MTKEWYISHGYAVSVNLDQTVIDRAESDVLAAYVRPLLPTATGAEENLQPLIADITILLVMERSLKITRSGTKTKNSPQSQNEGTEAALREQARTAAFALQRLRGMSETPKTRVTDICGLNFKTYLLGI